MTIIESKTENISAAQEVIFKFLNDFNNFNELLPKQVENWQSNQKNCSFSISGMPHIGLIINEAFEFDKITIISDEKSPLNFTMIYHIQKIDETNSTFKVEFIAEMNSFMLMMVKSPLQNFVNTLAEKLKLYYLN